MPNDTFLTFFSVAWKFAGNFTHKCFAFERKTDKFTQIYFLTDKFNKMRQERELKEKKKN